MFKGFKNNIMDYSINNALSFGFCRFHLEQTRTGSFSHRTIHLVVGLLEMVPIIGQIIALFEVAIAYRMGQSYPSPVGLADRSLSGVSEVSSPSFVKSSSALISNVSIENSGRLVENQRKGVSGECQHEDSSLSFSSTTGLLATVTSIQLTQVSRLPFSSFHEYQYQQQQQNRPVDLIIGRGRVTACVPVLNAERYVISTQNMAPYDPFTIDIASSQKPDQIANFLSKEELSFLPDSSVDDIYLESVFPLLWRDFRTYLNAARILKVDGTLLIDFNDEYRSDDQRTEYMEVLNRFFYSQNIPLTASLATELEGRNNQAGSKKFVCTKYYHAEIQWPKGNKLLLELDAFSREFRNLDDKFRRKR